jgi:8-oxo-dGTP diphosphatase
LTIKTILISFEVNYEPGKVMKAMAEKKIDFGVKAFIIHNDKFLVMHNYGEEQDLWELPGGRLEFGETAEKTVVRELIEETGLLIEPLKILDTWDLVQENYQITGIIYLCKLKEGEVKLSHEHDAYKWIDVERSSIETLYGVFKSRMINWDWEQLKKGIL